MVESSKQWVKFKQAVLTKDFVSALRLAPQVLSSSTIAKECFTVGQLYFYRYGMAEDAFSAWHKAASLDAHWAPIASHAALAMAKIEEARSVLLQFAPDPSGSWSSDER